MVAALVAHGVAGDVMSIHHPAVVSARYFAWCFCHQAHASVLADIVWRVGGSSAVAVVVVA